VVKVNVHGLNQLHYSEAEVQKHIIAIGGEHVRISPTKIWHGMMIVMVPGRSGHLNGDHGARHVGIGLTAEGISTHRRPETRRPAA
jgi:hypothetical protein